MQRGGYRAVSERRIEEDRADDIALNSTFIEAPFNWDKIRSNTGKALCLSGDNDPYVPVEQGRLLAERLGVPNRVILGGGHLNAESGYLTFPELLEALVCPED